MKIFVVLVISVMIFRQTLAMEVEQAPTDETKVVVKPRSKSVIVGGLAKLFSKLTISSKPKPQRSASVGARPAVIVPTIELAKAVAVRLDTSSPKALCQSINRMFMDEKFVETYALTPELLGLVLREFPKVDVNMRDSNGKAPLHFSHQYGQILVVRTLLCAGAFVNIQANDLKTPLHTQQFSCCINRETLQELLIRQADVTLRDATGKLPREGVSADFARLITPIETQQLKHYQDVTRVFKTTLVDPQILVAVLVRIILEYGII